MKRHRFEEINRADWGELEQAVNEMERGKLPRDPHRLPRLFRKVCGDLSLAQHRMYGLDLAEKLNHILIRAYGKIYAHVGGGLSLALRWAAGGFPRAVRREAKLFWLSAALYVVPLVGIAILAAHDPEWAEQFVGADSLIGVESSFGPDSDLDEGRGGDDADFLMFAFYIWNNIGWDFRIFGGGALFCVGGVYFLVQNAIGHGAVAGYVHHLHGGDWPEPFYAFVSGHSAPELTAMIIAAAAGLRLGLAVLNPGRLTRGKALAKHGKSVLPLICGAAVMTFCAAIIEGFWSASKAPVNTKYAVGIAFWLLLAAYLLFAGRRSADEA